MVIDCHTHWGICWQEKYGNNSDEWIAVLDRHSVDRAILFGHEGLTRIDKCADDNNNVARIAAGRPERLVPVLSAWPQQGKEGLREIVRCVSVLKMKGIKFHPWIQGFSTADPTFGEMCALAGELKVPVFFHDGTPCYSLTEQIAGLARRFPKTTFVLGHSGLLWNWRSVLSTSHLPNIWPCLCGPHLRAIEIICRKADPDRIIWGSDFGFGFGDPISYRLGLIHRAKISDSLREKILTINPERLLNLQIRQIIKQGK